jgi:hypothetical protein
MHKYELYIGFVDECRRPGDEMLSSPDVKEVGDSLGIHTEGVV